MAEGRNLLTENESKQLLASYGIPVVQTVVCETVEKAMETAESMKYPVVVKLNSETITHKSDVGGVQLNIKDKEGVQTAWNTIRNNLEKLGKIDGFQGVTYIKHHGIFFISMNIHLLWNPARLTF